MIVKLNVQQLKKEQKFQNRAELNQEVVQDYHEKMMSGEVFPPMTVFFDSVTYYLVDGYHRFYAYIKSKIYDVDCEVIDGTQRDAILYACGVNSKHGLKRSNADKRKSVMMLLNDDEWCKWSDHKIAEIVNVTRQFVTKIRDEFQNLTSNIASDELNEFPPEEPEAPEITEPELRTYVNKYGKTATMNVSNIGKKKKDDNYKDNFTMIEYPDLHLNEKLRRRLIGTRFFNNKPSLDFIASLDTQYDQNDCIDLLIKRKIKRAVEFLDYVPTKDIITDQNDPEFSILGRVKRDKDIIDLKNDVLNVLEAYKNVKSERCREIVSILSEYINYQLS
ncbi:MAG: ParB N-terminal domain-containing protein [Candidatus Kapabacteria bacterium]|nr:ParB N-terminal domain-containing protein [Ignavibacteriota bacterium]MCW5886440.1 ParB N-terminal domain-containing protein [Candidatus Kapabacteria bacterium]